MTSAPVTVVDRISFTCSVSPEQAAAYCRRHPRLAGWTERPPAYSRFWLIFDNPKWTTSADSLIMIPTETSDDGYSRRMAELCDALVALGCAERPSEILLGMGEERL